MAPHLNEMAGVSRQENKFFTNPDEELTDPFKWVQSKDQLNNTSIEKMQKAQRSLEEMQEAQGSLKKKDPNLTIMEHYINIYRTFQYALTGELEFLGEDQMRAINTLNMSAEDMNILTLSGKDQRATEANTLLEELRGGAQDRIASAPENHEALHSKLEEQLGKAVSAANPDFICMQEGKNVEVRGYTHYKSTDPKKQDSTIYAKEDKWKISEAQPLEAKEQAFTFKLKGKTVHKGSYCIQTFEHTKYAGQKVKVVCMHLPSNGNVDNVYEKANEIIQEAATGCENVVFAMDANTKSQFVRRNDKDLTFGSAVDKYPKDHKDITKGDVQVAPSVGPTNKKQRGVFQFQDKRTLDKACKDIIGYVGKKNHVVGNVTRWAGGELPPSDDMPSLPKEDHLADHAWVYGKVLFLNDDTAARPSLRF